MVSKPAGLNASSCPCAFQRAKSCSVWKIAVSTSSLFVLDLPVDLLVQHVAETAGNRDLDAGIALAEEARRRLPRRSRPPDIEHEGAFGLRVGVDVVDGLRANARTGRGDDAKQGERRGC